MTKSYDDFVRARLRFLWTGWQGGMRAGGRFHIASADVPFDCTFAFGPEWSMNDHSGIVRLMTHAPELFDALSKMVWENPGSTSAAEARQLLRRLEVHAAFIWPEAPQ